MNLYNEADRRAIERHSLTMSEKCFDLLYGCFSEPNEKSLPVVINKYCGSALSVCVSAGSRSRSRTAVTLVWNLNLVDYQTDVQFLYPIL